MIFHSSLLFLISTNIIAQTILTGDVGGLTLESSGNPYIIADNIIVSSGKTLRINSGVVLLFKPFTGLIVDEGNLDVKGTLEHPVVFTTENDKEYNPNSRQLPNPFDWNGILIKPNAGSVSFSNFILEYSVYGIKSQKEIFSINNGTFKSNGQFHLTVKEVVKPVVDNIPFYFGKINSDNVGPKITLMKQTPVVFMATGGILLGLSGYFGYMKTKYSQEYESAKIQKDIDNYIYKEESSLQNMIISAVVGGTLLGTGMTIKYLVKGRENNTVIGVHYDFEKNYKFICSYNF